MHFKLYYREQRGEKMGLWNTQRAFKHVRILSEQGLPFVGVAYFSDTFDTPFQRKISDKNLPIYKELVSFQRIHKSFTIRQFYYHLIQCGNPSLGASYEKTKRIVNRARLGGIIPFGSVLDDTDLLGTKQQNLTIEEFLKNKTVEYRSNWFENQDCYVEVWLEKRALERVIFPITDYYGVYLSCSGKNPTWSQVYSAIQRFKEFHKPYNYILYLGDLDPQGKDMVRWLEEEAFRVLEFEDVTIQPLALNLSHANDPKLNLYRTYILKGRKSVREWYQNTFGIDYTIELDALEPNLLRSIVEKGILAKLDAKEIERKRKEDEKQIKQAIGKLFP
jgi:hypothetical protein